MASKFKVGDIIRCNSPGKIITFYKVTKVTLTGYNIKSLERNYVYIEKEISRLVYIKTNVKDWVDANYRLASDMEYLLYGN